MCAMDEACSLPVVQCSYACYASLRIAAWMHDITELRQGAELSDDVQRPCFRSSSELCCIMQCSAVLTESMWCCSCPQ